MKRAKLLTLIILFSFSSTTILSGEKDRQATTQKEGMTAFTVVDDAGRREIFVVGNRAYLQGVVAFKKKEPAERYDVKKESVLVVELHTARFIQGDYLININCKLLLDPDSADAKKLKTGETIFCAGDIRKFDPFMNCFTLYPAEIVNPRARNGDIEKLIENYIRAYANRLSEEERENYINTLSKMQVK